MAPSQGPQALAGRRVRLEFDASLSTPDLAGEGPVVAAVSLWGAAIAGVGLLALVATPVAFIGVLGCLAVAGAADMVSAVLRTTIVQLEAPDELRGRVLSVHSLVVTAGPRLGDIQTSIMAAALGPGLALLVGGGLCLLGVAAVGRSI